MALSQSALSELLEAIRTARSRSSTGYLEGRAM